MHILYKSGTEFYIANWLFHNYHTENGDQEIRGMNVNIPTISKAADILICMSIGDIMLVTS